MAIDLYVREVDSLRFELSMNRCSDKLLRLAHGILEGLSVEYIWLLNYHMNCNLNCSPQSLTIFACVIFYMDDDILVHIFILVALVRVLIPDWSLLCTNAMVRRGIFLSAWK